MPHRRRARRRCQRRAHSSASWAAESERREEHCAGDSTEECKTELSQRRHAGEREQSPREERGRAGEHHGHRGGAAAAISKPGSALARYQPSNAETLPALSTSVTPSRPAVMAAVALASRSPCRVTTLAGNSESQRWRIGGESGESSHAPTVSGSREVSKSCSSVFALAAGKPICASSRSNVFGSPKTRFATSARSSSWRDRGGTWSLTA